jgi:hypothetical protein
VTDAGPRRSPILVMTTYNVFRIWHGRWHLLCGSLCRCCYVRVTRVICFSLLALFRSGVLKRMRLQEWPTTLPPASVLWLSVDLFSILPFLAILGAAVLVSALLLTGERFVARQRRHQSALWSPAECQQMTAKSERVTLCHWRHGCFQKTSWICSRWRKQGCRRPGAQLRGFLEWPSVPVTRLVNDSDAKCMQCSLTTKGLWACPSRNLGLFCSVKVSQWICMP